MLRRLAALAGIIASALLLFAGPADAARARRTDKLQWVRYAEFSAGFQASPFSDKISLASGKAETLNVFVPDFNPAIPPSWSPGNRNLAAPVATGAPVAINRDSLVAIGKLVFWSDSTVLSATIDTLKVTLYSATWAPRVTTAVSPASWLGAQCYRYRSGGHSTDNTTGTIEVPIYIPAGPLGPTETTAANFSGASPVGVQWWNDQMYATVAVVGGGFGACRVRFEYYTEQ